MIDYTKKAIDFAEAIDCKNIVFGCSRNRNIPNAESFSIAKEFFREIGEYANKHNTIIAIEPNPPIYNTNFINTTKEAFEICRQINRVGIKVNVDLGTMIYYGENMTEIVENLDLVNHMHISEPYLEQIEPRNLHKEIKQLNYDKFISIEMKNLNDIEIVKQTIKYVRGGLLDF